MNRFCLKTLCFCIAILALSNCLRMEENHLGGGGGVETTEGNIVASSGLASGALVRMVPVDFDGSKGQFPESLTTIARTNGSYTFKHLAPGKYNLDVYLPSQGTRAFRGGITLVTGQRGTPVSDTLRAPCQMRLMWEDLREGVLFQKGGLFKRMITKVHNETQLVILDSLPAGVLPPISFQVPNKDSASVQLTDSLFTQPGITSTLATYGDVCNSAKWSLDASLSGAALDSDVVDYPVLIRLTSPQFNFREASSNGSDLRFATNSGSPLPYSVERWDSANGKAEIWVRTTSLLGRLANQSFKMYWGNASSLSRSDSYSVFDTATGFIGVWHLDEVTRTDSAFVLDATRNRLVGPRIKLNRDSSQSALIAQSQIFDGAEGYAYAWDSTVMKSYSTFMVSAWIRPDFTSQDPISHSIIAKWEQKDSSGFWLGYAPDIKGFRLQFGLDSRKKIHVAEIPNQGFTPGDWHHIAAGYNGKEARIYWDGQIVHQSLAGSPLLMKNPRDLILGARGGIVTTLAEIDYWKGELDEIRFYHGNKSLDWLRLEYLTQKPQSSLLRFVPVK